MDRSRRFASFFASALIAPLLMSAPAAAKPPAAPPPAAGVKEPPQVATPALIDEAAQRALRAQQALSSAEARLFADRLSKAPTSKLKADRETIVAAAEILASAREEVASLAHAVEDPQKSVAVSE